MSNTDTDVHLHAFTEYSKVDKELNKMKDNPFKKNFFRKTVFLNVELNIC